MHLLLHPPPPAQHKRGGGGLCAFSTTVLFFLCAIHGALGMLRFTRNMHTVHNIFLSDIVYFGAADGVLDAAGDHVSMGVGVGTDVGFDVGVGVPVSVGKHVTVAVLEGVVQERVGVHDPALQKGCRQSRKVPSDWWLTAALTVAGGPTISQGWSVVESSNVI